MSKPRLALLPLFKETVVRYLDNGGSLLAGALAFQALLSLAPLVLIVVSLAGMVFGEETARNQLQEVLAKYAGKSAAHNVGYMMEILLRSHVGSRATLLGFALMLYTASRMFGQLQDALNQLARVQVPVLGWKAGIWISLYRQLVAVALVYLGGGIFTLILVVSAAAATLKHWFQEALPGSLFIWHLTPLLSTLLGVAVVFSVVYRTMSQLPVAWFDAAMGGLVGAFLFVLAEWPLSMYLGRTGVTSAFGAASSLVIFLLWIYYSAQIFFLGAQFTWVLAEARQRQSAPAATP